MSEFYFKEIKKNKYILLYINDDSSMSKINFEGKKLYSPFGIEEYNNKFILNLEVNNNNEILRSIKEIDNFLRSIESFYIGEKEIKLDDLEYYPIIKKRKDKKPIIRSHIKITRKKINTEIKNEKNDRLTIYEFPKKTKVNVILELGDLWIYKKKFGINIYCKNINIVL